MPEIHCPSCEKLIKASLSDNNAIQSVSVNLETKEVEVNYDWKKINKLNIIKIIQDWTGYSVTNKENQTTKQETIEVDQSSEHCEIPTNNHIDTNSKMISVDIEWMHCSSCALLIEKSLKKVAGVQNANVNFSSSQAMVKVSPNTSQPALIKSIEDAWYSWTIQDEKQKINETQKRKKETKYRWKKFSISAILSLPMILFMFYDFFPGIFPWWKLIMPWMAIISLALTTPVLFIIWTDFFKWARSALKMKTFNMYSLIAIGTWVAFVYSLYNFILFVYQTWSWIWLDGGKIWNIYFEVASLLIMFVSLWKLLEAKAKWSTSQAIEKLMWIRPKTAKVKRWSTFVNIAIDQVNKWDIVLVKPWEKIPVDWIIISWYSSIDESMLTWESIPVEKIIWAKVFAGTINKLWSFEFQVNRVWNETALSKIIRLIQEAQWSKAPIQWFADKISAIFVPSVIIIALIVFLIWFFIVGVSFTTALLYFCAVIVIACPCALWLATPTALMVWTGKGAEKWILIKWWEPLETLCKIDTIVFDKTWTITEWKPIVTDITSTNWYDKNLILQIATSLEIKSEHPLAEAIVRYWKDNRIWINDISNFQAIPGKWVKWKINGKTYFLGTKMLMSENNIPLLDQYVIEQLESEWKTVMLIATDKEMIGTIAVADTIKASSVDAIKKLKQMDITVYMITWDNERTARAIAHQVGIDNVFAQVLPENKASKVKELQDQWHIVAMVGDGINDSPALTQADVGIAMWSWADVAMESWNVVIMKNDLNDVLTAIKLSKETVNKIRQNMFFALFYNILWIPIAWGALAVLWLTLKPEFAWLAMAMSSVSVVLNSLLLKFFKPQRKNRISIFAPVIMTIVFLWFFRNFAKIWNWQNINFSSYKIWFELQKDITEFLTDTPNKIWFTPWGVPKILLWSDQTISWLNIYEWTWIFTNKDIIIPQWTGIQTIQSTWLAEMIIGFKEAQMMKNERLFKNIGDSLSGFFGLPNVKIVWIIAPTNTFLDEVHIINQKWFDWLDIKQNISIRAADFEGVDIFYFFDENNIPLKLKNIINPIKLSYNIDDKEDFAIYLGYDAAQEMRDAKEFSKKFDIIQEDGNDLVIAWLPKKTYTTLDMMHFIPKEFNN